MKYIVAFIIATHVLIPLKGYQLEEPREGFVAYLQQDTLVVGNALARHYYLWNKGNIIPIKFVNQQGIELQFTANNQPALSLPAAPAPKNDHFSTSMARLSPLDEAYLQVSITFELGDLSARHVISVYKDTPLVGHHFYLKGPTSLQWGVQEMSGSLGMIESDPSSQNNKEARMGIIPFQNPHWSVKAISFQDATDHYNTLVQETNYLAYNKPQPIAGNFFLATNPAEKVSVVVIKESPLGYSQQGYPGHDVTLDQNALQILGLGLLPRDLRAGDWVRGYGYAVGITSPDALAPLKAARNYQKGKRKQLSERDEMILSNTWGDRSRDSRMNEAFILKELEAGARLGITHLQLDDGWQQGLSKNSASKAGLQWDNWSRDDWKPHPVRFPNGLEPILAKARQHDIAICLWFNPTKTDDYAFWERDADILIDFYNTLGIKVFKIDGIELSGKQAEENLRSFFEKVLLATGGEAVFNLDVTAGRRMGYHYFTEYGNIFLENRYTDWVNYYPHRTLRNLWMLSRYIPVEKLQIEFLNPWRNQHKYLPNDPLAPANIPFDYQVAVTLVAQPLAWMELSQLPREAGRLSSLLEKYTSYRHKIHQGTILPVGDEPGGYGWTGFQSLVNDKEGYLLVFREHHPDTEQELKTWLMGDQNYQLTGLLGDLKTMVVRTSEHGKLKFDLPAPFSFALYHYERVD